MSKTAIVRDHRFLEHRTGSDHPESPQRIEAIYNMLERPEMVGRFATIEPRLADKAEILLVHSPAYLKKVAATATRAYTALSPDTIASSGSYEAARLAVGGLLQAVTKVGSGCYANAFALVRPPGHHAEVNRAMGYCLFNNAAVAAAYARKVLGMARVLILDWDVHHGNGTQHIFEMDNSVLFFSIHQYPHYPGTGSFTETGLGRGEGFTVNLPLARGYGDSEYASILHALLPPMAAEFKPDIIIVSAGFDPHEKDPLGNMRLSLAGFAALTRCLMEIADACCDGRIVMVLEGGYDIRTIGDNVKAVLDELSGKTKCRVSELADSASAKKVHYTLKRSVNVHRRYWKCLSHPLDIRCANKSFQI
jgi:acetoin utilization deacetylase AcuC-like enzyme